MIWYKVYVATCAALVVVSLIAASLYSASSAQADEYPPLHSGIDLSVDSAIDSVIVVFRDTFDLKSRYEGVNDEEITACILEILYDPQAKGAKNSEEYGWCLAIHNNAGFELISDETNLVLDTSVAGQFMYVDFTQDWRLHISDLNGDGYKDLIFEENCRDKYSCTFASAWMYRRGSNSYQYIPQFAGERNFNHLQLPLQEDVVVFNWWHPRGAASSSTSYEWSAEMHRFRQVSYSASSDYDRSSEYERFAPAGTKDILVHRELKLYENMPGDNSDNPDSCLHIHRVFKRIDSVLTLVQDDTTLVTDSW